MFNLLKLEVNGHAATDTQFSGADRLGRLEILSTGSTGFLSGSVSAKQTQRWKILDTQSQLFCTFNFCVFAEVTQAKALVSWPFTHIRQHVDHTLGYSLQCSLWLSLFTVYALTTPSGGHVGFNSYSQRFQQRQAQASYVVFEGAQMI